MKSKGLFILLGIFALVAAFVLLRGFGKDESVDDRKANYNQQMEDVMRSNGRRQEMEEEKAEFGESGN